MERGFRGGSNLVSRAGSFLVSAEEVEAAGEGQRRDEAGQWPSGAADGDLAEAGPVDLALLTWKHSQVEERFLRSGAKACDQTAELDDAAFVIAIPDHLIDPRGADARILLEDAPDEVGVWVGNAGAQTHGLGCVEALGLNRPSYGVGMDLQLAGDRADLPMLG